MWFETLPWAYSEIEAPIEPHLAVAHVGEGLADLDVPSRSAFTSVPLSTMPASTRSRSS